MATHSSVVPGESQGRGSLWTAVYGVAQSRTRLSSSSTTAKAAGRKISTRPEIYHLLQLGAQPLSAQEPHPYCRR